jgi:hypothetical protein
MKRAIDKKTKKQKINKNTPKNIYYRRYNIGIKQVLFSRSLIGSS